MKLQFPSHLAAACCILATAWISAPVEAQRIPKGPLSPHVAEQVRAIIMAQIKASPSVPPIEEGAVVVIKLDKETPPLTVTIGGQTYTGKVFRTFLVEPASSTEYDAKEYYVRTTGPWKLKDGRTIPPDTYLSGYHELVSAYDKDAIDAQDAAIARSEGFYKTALAQLGPERKNKAAAVADAHKADMDALNKQVKDLTAEIAKKQAFRDQLLARLDQFIRRQNQQLAANANQPTQLFPSAVVVQQPSQPSQAVVPANLRSGKDPEGNPWQWNGNTVTFNDKLDDAKQDLAKANAALKALQGTIDNETAAAAGSPGLTESELMKVFKGQRKRILGGEVIADADMRAEYEAVLGEPLGEAPAPPAAGQQPNQNAPARNAPIQSQPQRRRGT